MRLIFTITILILLSYPFILKADFKAKITLVKGHAVIISNHGTILAKKGIGLNINDKIKTSRKTLVKIIYENHSTTTIGLESTLMIKKSLKKDVPVFNLITGQIKSYVLPKNNKNKKLIIKTNTASLGVRGTVFHLKTNGENDELYVEKGLVEYKTKYGLKNVTKKEYLSATKNIITLNKINNSPKMINESKNKYRVYKFVRKKPRTLKDAIAKAHNDSLWALENAKIK